MPRAFKSIADFYRVKRLSDVLSEEEILVMAAGFSDQMDLPIVIAELDESNMVKIYEPYRIEQLLHPTTRKARKEQTARYIEEEKKELEKFIARGQVKRASLWWDGAVYFRRGIRIGGVPVAMAIGGGHRVIGELPSPSKGQRILIEGILDYDGGAQMERITREQRVILEDRNAEPVAWTKYRDDYDKFAEKVLLIEALARDRFRSKRFDLENKFFGRIRRGSSDRDFHLPKQEEDFQKAYRGALEEVNSFCGYSYSALMVYSRDEGFFKVYLSTLQREKERQIGVLGPDANWDTCFKWAKPIYVEPNIDQSMLGRHTGIDMAKLTKETQLIFPFASIKRCLIFPYTAEDRRWIFFFVYEKAPPPVEDFFEDNRRLMEAFCSRISNDMSRAYAEMDRRDYLDRVAHETMNPIAKVKWHAEYIKIKYDQIERKDVFRKLSDIINECDRAVKTAEKILKLSGRIKTELRPEKVDFFEKIAKPIVHQVKHERPDLFIEYSNLVRMPHLYIDFGLLYDVVFNILDNAVKYSSKNTTIVFSYESQGKGILISVSNTGIGIPEGEDTRIFKLGVKGSNASRVSVRGTGQGLAICKMYIEQKLGGRIWFERGDTTHHGNEITFKVFLPNKFIAGGDYGQHSHDRRRS